jgi:hypothetical protein
MFHADDSRAAKMILHWCCTSYKSGQRALFMGTKNPLLPPATTKPFLPPAIMAPTDNNKWIMLRVLGIVLHKTNFF